MIRMVAIAAAAAALITAAGAQAAQFDLSFSDTQNLFGSESISGSNILLTATPTTPGDYIVTALSGNVTISGASSGNGTFALSLNSPGTVIGTSSNDNVLLDPASPGYFDQSGLGFQANGVNYDLYGIGEGFSGIELVSNNHIPFGAATVSISAAAPEPSTWAMMLLGFLGLGTMAYRRKRTGEALSLA